MNKHISTRIYGLERLTLWFFITGSAACIGLYIYFLSVSVASIVLRQETALQIRSLGGEVSTLEAQYLAKKESIGSDTAQALGFVAITDAQKIFLTRSGVGTALSFANVSR